MSSEIIPDMVEISTERLKKLEELEASIPKLIEDALKEYKMMALRRLHEKDKANPEAVNLRAKRYAQKNREMLNAKRREKRRLEKLAKEESKKQADSIITVVAPLRTRRIVKVASEPVTVALGQSSLNDARIEEFGRTINFSD